MVALVALVAGTFGLFGRQRDPLAGVFVVLLGWPWTLLMGRLPDGTIRIVAGMLTPAVNLGLLWALCRSLRRS